MSPRNLALAAFALAASSALAAGNTSQLSASSSSDRQYQAASGSASSAQDSGSTSSQGSGSTSSGGDENVRQLQQALQQQGHDPGPIDGKMGPNTQQALQQFQQAKGLQASGQPDSQTLAALGVGGTTSATNGSSSNGASSGGSSSATNGASSNGASSGGTMGSDSGSGNATGSSSSGSQKY